MKKSQIICFLLLVGFSTFSIALASEITEDPFTTVELTTLKPTTPTNTTSGPNTTATLKPTTPTNCNLSLGVGDGRIKDEQLSASSELDDIHAAKQGRVSLTSPSIDSSWCANPSFYQNTALSTEYLQVDLLVIHAVSAVSTQGSVTENSSVSSYLVHYSLDGNDWIVLTDKGGEVKEFNGSSDQSSIIRHWLKPHFHARFVRFVPLSWVGRQCMRVELHGCDEAHANLVNLTRDLENVDGPTTNVWYKAVHVGRNTQAKQMKTIASIASLDGKFTNSSGRKTVIQSLREDFHPLEISELTGDANPDSISSYSHNPLGKQRRMSNKLAGFSSSTIITDTAANASGGPRTEALREVYVNSPALPSVFGNNTTTMDNGNDGLPIGSCP